MPLHVIIVIWCVFLSQAFTGQKKRACKSFRDVAVPVYEGSGVIPKCEGLVLNKMYCRVVQILSEATAMKPYFLKVLYGEHEQSYELVSAYLNVAEILLLL